MKVVQSVAGKFHHFHLARQLHARGILECIFTSYPWRVLRTQGLPREKVRSFPWIHTLLMGKWRLGIVNKRLDRHMAWWTVTTLDRHAARSIPPCDVFIALSSSGLKTGALVKARGGRYVCDRGSAHIRYQTRLLTEEWRRWGLEFDNTDPRSIAREEEEYALADVLTVPSEFARRSFLESGVEAGKLRKIPYGADLARFGKTADPPRDSFAVLFAGQVSLRKGLPYLVEAFQQLKHPAKVLRIVGSVQPEMQAWFKGRALEGIELLGVLPQARLKECMNASHVMVLPSIEEGLALVQGEALACGCPVIGTPNSGAEDLFSDGKEGFIVPIRDPRAIAERLEQLAQDRALRDTMSAAALERVKCLGGWDVYGEAFFKLCEELALRRA